MTAIDRAQAAAAREQNLREDLDAYLRNVRVGRLERDDDYEERLRAQIADSEQAWQEALSERPGERDADRQPQTRRISSSKPEAIAAGSPAAHCFRSPDGRTVELYLRECVHISCWASRCECGHELTAHDFDPESARRSAADALAKPAHPPFFGHPSCGGPDS